VLVAGSLCVSACAMGASTPQLSGKWSGRYSGAYSGTFKLHWTETGSTLSGSIVFATTPGTYKIIGRVTGNKISFGAVAVGASYVGTISGTSMSGSYKTPPGAGSWSAHKTA
jgi:hypothetical protein